MIILLKVYLKNLKFTFHPLYVYIHVYINVLLFFHVVTVYIFGASLEGRYRDCAARIHWSIRVQVIDVVLCRLLTELFLYLLILIT